MKLAAKRFENVAWVALVFCVAILLYPLWLGVGAVRSDIVETDLKILATRERIRYLETEIETRANPQHLEDWNAMEFGYRPPSAEQFLAGERALAGLSQTDGEAAPMTMVATLDGVKPAGMIGSVFGRAQAAKRDPLAPQSAANGDSSAAASKTDPAGSAGSDPSQRRASQLAALGKTEKVARLDEILVNDDVLNARATVTSRSDDEGEL